MGSRELVDIGLPPGVDERLLVLEIRPIPVGFVAWRFDQSPQALLLAWIVMQLELVDVQDRAQLLDLNLGGFDPGMAQVADEPRYGNTNQKAKDRQNHQQLGQGIAALGANA